MTEGKKIKVGVVGVGSLGMHHARIYSGMAGVELVGIYDSDPARAQQISEQYGTKSFSSLSEMSSQIEAASVVVPTDRHSEVANFLLNNGVHLLVEKPIASSTEEAEKMVATAQKQGVILQVGHIERFNPVLTILENRKKKPLFIEAHRLAPYPPPRPGATPRGTEVSVILDLMIHDLELILHLVNAWPNDIRAVGVPVLSASEDIANVRLAFPNGCVANITASRISPDRLRKIRVFFDDAYVSLDYQQQTGEIRRKTATGITREEIPVEKGEPLALELQSFIQCVARRGQPLVTGEHAADALKLAMKIVQNLRIGPS